MANVIISDTHLLNIAEAIRYKNGTSKTYKPKEMAAAIQALEGIDVDPLDFDDYISRNLSGIVEIACTRVGPYGLAGASEVTKFILHTNANGAYAFKGCAKLQELVITRSTGLGQHCADGCTTLATVSAPECSSVGNYAFWNCNALTSITLGNLKRVGTGAFEGCNRLTKIDLGDVTVYDSEYPTSLILGGSAFYSDSLEAIIIRGNRVPLVNEQVYPFPDRFNKDYSGDGLKGYIYVPAAMISEYENYEGDPYAASPKYDRFSMLSYRAIEDYPEICG